MSINQQIFIFVYFVFLGIMSLVRVQTWVDARGSAVMGVLILIGLFTILAGGAI